MTEEQIAVLKEAMAILSDAANNKQENYLYHTTDQHGTHPGVMTRSEYLEHVVASVDEQLNLAFYEE